MAKNIAKKVVRPIDSYLKFVQQSFNTSGVSFRDIAKQLNALSKQLNIPGRTKINKQQASEARDLYIRLGRYTIISDNNKYNKFDKLGNFGLDGAGLNQVYKVSDEIINDIYNARDWISDYKDFSERYKDNTDTEILHDELILLGQSILGRAVELCPMDTGTLRRSGVVLDFGTHIRIAFTAPYATYVHENMDISHPQHGNRNCGGQAKFLETALQEFFPNKSVWTETTGQGDVAVEIGINPLWLNYIHYGG